MSDQIRKLLGRVISNKMDKTITVLVDRKVRHPLYGKFLTKSTKYHAHDGLNQCNEGDKVEIAETRPYSKTKNWRLVSILEHNK